jgi:amino acid adenylation domain-containing protein
MNEETATEPSIAVPFVRESWAENLAAGFMRSSELYPDRPAVQVGGQTFSYSDVRAKALQIASMIGPAISAQHSGLCAVLAYRSITAFTGTLASLVAGGGYVPLNPTFPIERTLLMLARSRCPVLIVDAAAQHQLDRILELEAPSPLLVILPDTHDTSPFASRWARHRFVGAAELQCQPSNKWENTRVADDSIAYLLFTSGSTGVPKGVKVAHRNVLSFVNAAVSRYAITEHDRFSQTFDMTFDLSAFDMFVAWERGACVCCPSRKTLINPAAFIRESELTVWFSVPSIALMMKQLGSLKPNVFPRLRWSLFCGEPLPTEIAQLWASAAPNSLVENLYGPTEVTIACTAYRWDPAASPRECERDLAPIGWPLPGMATLVADDHLRELAPGEEGELLMSGPQVALGYWQDAERTAAAFVIPPGKNALYYRTGDRVRRPGGDGPLTFLGRVDHQIKVHGHRVELGEIEALIRREARVDAAVAIGWPLTPSGAAGIEAFIADSSLDTDRVHRALKALLPIYAVPRAIHCIQRWPLNSNGKIDRKMLCEYLKGQL